MKKNSVMTTAPNAESTMKPISNPHPKNTALARAYEAGWRKARREREALEDRILEDLGSVGEALDGLRNRYQVRIARCARKRRA
jgi:uncharacterized protein YjiS (DUF1127 family)